MIREMKNVFDLKDSSKIIDRINNLGSSSQGLWGKMNVSQMLAHCNVIYEMIYSDIHPKPSGFKKLILKLLVKPFVVDEKPYKKNLRTASHFLIVQEKEFENEKNRLIDYITKTQNLGETYFRNKESHSFGVLSIKEWNIMLYKHLDHHLRQFGV